MSAGDAIIILEAMILTGGKEQIMTSTDAIDAAKEALRKQIPMVSVQEYCSETGAVTTTCPTCEKHIAKVKYCYYCGQLINWIDGDYKRSVKKTLNHILPLGSTRDRTAIPEIEDIDIEDDNVCQCFINNELEDK